MRKALFVCCFYFLASGLFSQTSDSLQVWVKRTVAPQTIYYEGAGGGDTAKVVVRTWASTDSAIVGQPLDVLMLLDNTGSMNRCRDHHCCADTCKRAPIGYDTTKKAIYNYNSGKTYIGTWVPEIQCAYNASTNFIDSVMGPRDRIAAMRYAGGVDTLIGYNNNFALTKAILDTNLDGWNVPNPHPYLIQLDALTDTYVSLLNALRYMAANSDTNKSSVLILMTDGADNASGNYGNRSTWPASLPNLGNTPAKAADSVIKVIDSLNRTGFKFKIFTISLGTPIKQLPEQSDLLDSIARHGNGKWAHSKTGANLDSVFQSIASIIYDVAAVKINSSTPMLTDVLGKDIHYVPNSFTIHNDSSNYITNVSFTSRDTLTYTGLHTKLNITVDTIKVGQLLEFEYKITAALREFDPSYLTVGKIMAVNNSRLDDSAAYSLIKYKNYLNLSQEKQINKSVVYVKTKLAGTYLSTRGDTLLPPDPLGNKTVTLIYSTMSPDSFGPVNLYGVQKVDATGTSQYTNTAVYWSFTPKAEWTNFGDPAVDFTQAPSSYRLFGFSVMGDSTKQGRDTLNIKSVDGIYTDHVVFNAMFVDKPYVAGYRMDPVVPTAAGTPLSVTWKAVDAAGNVISDPLLMPDSVCIYSDQAIRIIRAPGDTINLLNSTDKQCWSSNPFSGGTMTVVFYSTTTDSLDLQFHIYNDGIDSTKNVELIFKPGVPDHVRLVYMGGSTDAARDTLSTFGSENSTQRSYAALLFDYFGNAITDPNILRNFQWQAVREGDNLSQISSDIATYKALNSAGNFLDTLYVSYVDGGQTQFRDAVLILVLPIVKVLSVTTHEWIPSLENGADLVKFVLDSVLQVSTDSLNTAAATAGLTQNEMVLRELQTYGYPAARDGYLDYLDITLSTGIMLKSEFITGIAFDTLIAGRADTVTWVLSKTVNGRTLRPKLTALDGSRTRYRLWLIPNVLGTDAPLETGFLPELRFDNSAIQYENMPPLRLGAADNEYRTPASIVTDSAAPVVDRFIFQNNKCNPDNKRNTAQITFSEPVRFGADLFTDLRALTLQNGTLADSAFMLTAVSGATGVNRKYSPEQAWNLEYVPGAVMTYEVEIRPDKENLFKEEVSKMRFSTDSANTQIADAAGNSGCVGINRPVTLENDITKNAVCNVTGLTVVDRYDATGFTWGVSTEPGSAGEEVPLFPFFGFEVNLSLMSAANGSQSHNLLTSACGDYILVDYDPTVIFVSSEVAIYDLLGNLTASPKTNKSLKMEYTVKDVKQFLGLPTQINCSAIDTSQFILLRGQAGAKDTLMVRYPATLPLGYEFMKQVRKNGGNQSGVPSWNCLNAKGRLVAPGGYIVSQRITAMNKTETVTKKLIITSKKRDKGL